MKKELTCIVCPRGCNLTIDDDLNISGNKCPRGVNYAQNELTNPKRMLTTTVEIKSEELRRLPVASTEEVAKDMIPSIMKELDKLKVMPPVSCGDIIATDICKTGVNIKATRSVKK